MLLSITSKHSSARDLSYLLHKHPDRFQSYDLSFGRVHVFYPEVADDCCTACLLLDVDPVGLVRGRGTGNGLLSQYVNDRTYAASSFLSVAIAQVYGSALQGRCKDRPDLPDIPIPLSARIDVLPVRGCKSLLAEFFEPLGYTVEAERHALDDEFPEWGEGPYFTVTLSTTARLSELLAHLYVLIPVFDNHKHYYVGDDELEKLLAHGGTWLAGHPQKEEITRRYLKFQPSLYRQALARLAEDVDASATEDDESQADSPELSLEKPLSLNDQRMGAVVSALLNSGARRMKSQRSSELLSGTTVETTTARSISSAIFTAAATSSKRCCLAWAMKWSRVPPTATRSIRARSTPTPRVGKPCSLAIWSIAVLAISTRYGLSGT